ncbi:MAG: hypothetical protein KatS3mg014_0769 [Actinomycetota bacterium]|nr:MAG: hypothetical protein KatS3mg014_0769 [Actinomycetota bacterium]
MSARPRMDRRAFLGWMSSRGLALGFAGTALPTFLAACRDQPAVGGTAGATAPSATARATSTVEGTPIVGDVLDFSLGPGDWEGAFGSVTLRLHRALVDGGEAYFIRTDASDEDFARTEGHVFVPRLSGLAPAGRTGDAYLLDDGSTILSSHPGLDDYTPAWQLHRVRAGDVRLRSADDVRRAASRGEIAVERTGIVVNWPVVKWPGGELLVDPDLKEYLGGGQLIEPPDTAGMTVTFKLHECFPEARYIVCDTSMPPMAEGMHIAASPGLADAPSVGATGRVNVFMNGIPGTGPMGYQPSVFDAKAGEPSWSPYWDHFTYAWRDETSARVLRSQGEIEQARDGGELDEFPGTPDTGGQVFTVNCPVPVVAPNTFTG